MVTPFSFTLTPATADDDIIATSQTPAAGGEQALTLVGGGTVILDVARQVLLTTAANETSRTFTITGTDRYGNVLTEIVTGVNNTTVGTQKDFKSITQILVDDNTAGAIKFGTSNVVRSEWLRVDKNGGDLIGFGVTVTGLTYTVEHTFDLDNDDPPKVFPHISAASKTTDSDGSYIAPIAGLRLKVTAGSNGTNTVTLRGLARKG